jgi:ribose transport system substrate-binding protein
MSGKRLGLPLTVMSTAALAVVLSSNSALASQASCNTLKEKPTGATIAYLPPGLEFPYYIGIGEGAKMVAQKYHYSMFTSAPVSGADYAGQVGDMRDAIAKGVDGIIWHTHNNEATAPLVKEAVSKGIAVVTVNQDLTAFPAPLHAVVGYKEFDTDKKMGEYAVQLMHGTANIGLIDGLPGYDSTQRIDGFKAGITGHPGMKVVAEEVGNWDTPGGNKAAMDMLTAHPEINLIFSANDFMSEGAYQAAQALHRTDLSILGSDGDTNAFELIYNNGKGSQYKATMNTVPVLQGETAMQVMHECLTHTFKGFYVETSSTLVTRANVLEVLKDYKMLWPKPKHRY